MLDVGVVEGYQPEALDIHHAAAEPYNSGMQEPGVAVQQSVACSLGAFLVYFVVADQHGSAEVGDVAR